MTTSAPAIKPLTQAEIDREMMRMKRARTLLLIKHPFFGYLAAKLKLVASEQYDTLATDGVHMYFNPRFTVILDDDLTLTGFVHEVMHCVCEHFGREGTREPKRWRKAADHAINPILVKSGFKPIVVPGKFEWLCDPKTYGGKTAEAIYDMLPPEPPGSPNEGCVIISIPGGNTPGDGQGKGDDQQDPQTDGGGKAADPNAPPPPPPVNWKRATVEAAEFAKVRGNLPGHIEEMVGKIVHPRVDWKRYIKLEMSHAVKTDWTYRRPNRRYIWQGIILPTAHGYSTSGEWWGDTSGSIPVAFFEMGLGAGVDIARIFKIRLNAGVCDAEVQGFWPGIEGTDFLRKVKFLGRGGTDFRPIFQHIRDGKRKPDFVVVCTDLCGTFPKPEEKPPYRVVWLTTELYKDVEVPFGRKVIVSTEELQEKGILPK